MADERDAALRCAADDRRVDLIDQARLLDERADGAARPHAAVEPDGRDVRNEAEPRAQHLAAPDTVHDERDLRARDTPRARTPGGGVIVVAVVVRVE